MRLWVGWLIASLALAAPAPAQQASGPWAISADRVTLPASGISFPRQAGTAAYTEAREFSAPGEGIDNAAQYKSSDGAVFATIYIYYPGLAHTGLAAFATDNAIRLNSQAEVRRLGTKIVGAGAVKNAAIRADYAGYQDGKASSAAFIKVGRWMVKIRVSGPEPRRAEVDAAMTTLLEGIVFGANPPFPATPLTVTNCPRDTEEKSAKLLPDPAGPELAAHGFLATFDGGGNLGTDQNGARRDLPSRIPPDLCLSSNIGVGGGNVPILRAAQGKPRSVDGRTRLLAVISDSGMTLEVIHAENLGRYVVLFHNVGSTAMLGGYDAVPSDRQIAELLNDPKGDASRIRVPVKFRPGRGPEMQLPGMPPRQATPQT